MSEDKVLITLIICLTILLVLFAGTPDISDAITNDVNMSKVWLKDHTSHWSYEGYSK